MFENMNEEQARAKILDEVREYAAAFHQRKKYEKGDRISYGGRVYDGEEMTNLVDASLKFWLTSGEYTKAFEKKFAEYLGVPYCLFHDAYVEASRR